NVQVTASNQGWHTAQWGLWGWLETTAKCVALVFGFIDLLNPLPSAFMLGGNPHLAALIVLALLTLASIAQVAIRFRQRETISMGFALFNCLGHVALLIALAQVPHHRLWPVLFGAFYFVGQLVKIQFLRVTGYTENGANTPNMLRAAGVMAGLYALFTVLMLPA
ncbi:MAG TPA: hypothetical protein VMT34_02845, partial [Aggregatilineales bacterium]|nr:hypothetical protein [Aggregatilineales bacterium]